MFKAMEITTNNLRKVNDYLWEIPQGFRPDMRVPARIYASEKMLGEICRDRSLEQLVNVATLPGIQKYALAMPDVHEGYGFPVGGVAAFDAEAGVISPGGIGYDINCLPPDAAISLPWGAYLKIKDLARVWNKQPVRLINKTSAAIGEAKIINFFGRQENDCLYLIKTKLGLSLRLTGDHPVYTQKGMRKAAALEIGEKIVTYPFRGTEYEEAPADVIFGAENIDKAISDLGLDNSGSRRAQIFKRLEGAGLAEVRYNSPALPYLIKVLGIILGRGAMNLIGKKRKGRIVIYGKKTDLISVGEDLARVGIGSKIYSRRRRRQMTNAYGKAYEFSVTESVLHINSTAAVLLFYLLGAPLGNKTAAEFSVPGWLHRAPRWQKRIFLSSFFGAEMNKPQAVNKFNFYSPAVGVNKILPLKNNGVTFLNALRALLKDLGVKTSKITAEKKTDKTLRLRFQISSSAENLINFFSGVGFEYNREKQKLACLAAAYLRYKKEVVGLRRRVQGLVREKYISGIPAAVARRGFASFYTPPQFINYSIWSPDRVFSGVAFNFPSFQEFVKERAYGNDGFVWDEIIEVHKERYGGRVYDFTVNHPDHNFIADGVVVSNCGVRLLKSELSYAEAEPHLGALAKALFREIPSGVGRGGRLKLNDEDLNGVLRQGVGWMAENGYAEKGDAEHIESRGALAEADPDAVSREAKNRGRDQLGTMGAGNHFVEVDRVEKILNPEAAQKLGLREGQIVILIHCGSRGLGHQVATDYIRVMLSLMPKYGITLPDRELACAPFTSPEGKRYFAAMAAAANFAWANRELITWEARRAWREVFGEDSKLDIVYDVAHNIAKIEEYFGKKMVVHRKGATRAFEGQPVLIPGSMGTASYVLLGTKESIKEVFGSTCHGAGRRMSRHAAKSKVRGSELKSALEKEGIHIAAGSFSGLAEEAPFAYKDVDEVVEVVHRAGIAEKVARLRPVAVIKG
jgi:tRNA-splicing ligase RtcB